MIIKEDFSYIEKDMKFIDKGYAQLDIHSIRIDRHFTEEQKEQNRQTANSITSEQWGKHCDEMAQKIGEKVKSIVDYLIGSFIIYQYKDDSHAFYKSDWDLFFWCNCKEYGRDYSYVTLSFNDKRTIEQRFIDKDKVIELLKKRFDNMEGVIVYIQYTVKYDNKKIKETVSSYIPKILNTPINFMGYNGKIKSVGNDHYGFFKKGAKTKYHAVSDMTILSMALA